MILLTQVRQRGLRELRKASQQLNLGQKLDCSGVSGLERKELRALFYNIRSEWRNKIELEQFIDINTLNDDLYANICNFLDEPSPSPYIRIVLGVLLIFVVPVGALGLMTAPYFQKPKLQANFLTIGTLSTPEYHADLVEYLEGQLVPSDFWQFLRGKRVKVVIDGNKDLPYQEAERRIANKEWDIAFTLSPVISVVAKDDDYAYVAKMFPKSKNYQSALFVKANSPINSIDDLKPTTVIALGGFNSASSFYMPSYDLYGKSLTVNMGHRGTEILEMVKAGKVDIGAAALGDTVRAEDPSVRVIHQSRDIPGAGVYLSPRLSDLDRQTLKKVLSSAPEAIQKKSNFGVGEEPDYAFFREIVTKVEHMQICSDFTKNPVSFFCADNYKPIVLIGTINGWSYRANALVLNLRESSGKVYRIDISPQLLAEVLGSPKPADIQGKEVQVITANAPQQLPNGSFRLKLSQARQIKVLANIGRVGAK